jgi:2-polyprenyl-3-methyl-5-hydroxy-6-metoxy-1,4-benzoquinol methylase
MERTHVCPWWLGYFLLNPFRKYGQDPEKIMGKYIKKGMTLIDYGSAMGYFSLPMARMTGSTGKVFCFDIQQKMLNKLMKRAKRNGLAPWIKPVLIVDDSKLSEVNEAADFALLFAVAHEVPNREKLFINLSNMLKKDALLVFAEPRGHVKPDDFEESVAFAEKAGFQNIESLNISRSYAVLLQKK